MHFENENGLWKYILLLKMRIDWIKRVTGSEYISSSL